MRQHGRIIDKGMVVPLQPPVRPIAGYVSQGARLM